MATPYLVLYNTACAVGWSYVAYLTATHLHTHTYTGKESLDSLELWNNVEMPLKVVQTAAVLEIVHAATGLVRSSAVTTFIQVFSRVFVLWGISHTTTAAQSVWPFALMAASWAAVEVIRYSYYVAALIATPPGWLTWLRYSAFLILYPSGISGEVLSIIAALPTINRFDISMPNTHNIAIDFKLALYFVLLTYIPGSYVMFTHMLAQRRKVLSKSATGDAKKRA